MLDLVKGSSDGLIWGGSHGNTREIAKICRKIPGMFNSFKWAILLLILINLSGCSDGNPQVDFLISPTIQKIVKPGSPSSVNLSPTTVVTGGSYQVKGRVTYLETQKELNGGSYKIKGKISF